MAKKKKKKSGGGGGDGSGGGDGDGDGDGGGGGGSGDGVVHFVCFLAEKRRGCAESIAAFLQVTTPLTGFLPEFRNSWEELRKRASQAEQGGGTGFNRNWRALYYLRQR